MGGILGRRAWERSNGGLWLPEVRWSPVQMGFCCCPIAEPWEGCPVCSAEARFWDISAVSKICEMSAKNYIVGGISQPLSSSTEECYWQSQYGSPPEYVQVHIYATGVVEVVFIPWFGGYATAYYSDAVFSGDPPFDCTSIEGLALPFDRLSVLGSCPGHPDEITLSFHGNIL